MRNFRIPSPANLFTSSPDAASLNQNFLPPDVPRDNKEAPSRRRPFFKPEKVNS